MHLLARHHKGMTEFYTQHAPRVLNLRLNSRDPTTAGSLGRAPSLIYTSSFATRRQALVWDASRRLASQTISCHRFAVPELCCLALSTLAFGETVVRPSHNAFERASSF